MKLPSTLKTIGSGAFSGSGLKTIVVPDSVTTLGNYVFEKCPSLYFAEIGDGISVLNGDMFRECPSLRGVKLGRNVEWIRECCFYRCARLR